ncbi:MAG: histidine phosphatase family protein [Clostridia bacterium]|nr:histidine phosphatase family protein [Clostridia bacterium]
MNVLLIRHGLTRGNLEHRYIGSGTDEPLCEEGIRQLQHTPFPPVARVYVSPMLRCRMTAELLYPHVPAQVIPDFRECSFGLYEGKNYAELNGLAAYQAYIDSGGTLPFPGGESQAEMRQRCIRAYRALIPELMACPSALIVHGGTIMSILDGFARPHRPYFDWRTENGHGYSLSLVDGSVHPLP